MKPTPTRLKLESYPHQVEIPPRFSDVDMFRHLNNVAIGQFYEEVRFSLLAVAREKIPRERNSRLLIANVDMAYLREGAYPGVVTVGTGLLQFGRKSLRLGQGLFQNGVCFSCADTTVVYVENNSAAPLAPQITAVFADLKLPDFVDDR